MTADGSHTGMMRAGVYTAPQVWDDSRSWQELRASIERVSCDELDWEAWCRIWLAMASVSKEMGAQMWRKCEGMSHALRLDMLGIHPGHGSPLATIGRAMGDALRAVGGIDTSRVVYYYRARQSACEVVSQPWRGLLCDDDNPAADLREAMATVELAASMLAAASLVARRRDLLEHEAELVRAALLWRICGRDRMVIEDDGMWQCIRADVAAQRRAGGVSDE